MGQLNASAVGTRDYNVLKSYKTDAGEVAVGSIVKLSDKEAKPLLDEGFVALKEEEAVAPAPAPASEENTAPTSGTIESTSGSTAPTSGATA